MCFWPNARLISSSTPSTPPKPLPLLANGWSWLPGLFSTIVPPGPPRPDPPTPAPAEAVALARDRLVVARVHVLPHRPRRPARREPALRGARGQDLPRGRLDVLPRLRRLRRVEPGLLEGVLVVVEDRRRRVERQRVQLVVLRVVAHDRLDEVVPLERDLVPLHEVVDRVDRARHQLGLGPDLEDLDDVRRPLLAVGRDRGRQRLRVVALAEGLDLVLPLAVVELLRQRLERGAQLARHRVPEVDLRLRLRGRPDEEHRDRNGERWPSPRERLHGPPPRLDDPRLDDTIAPGTGTIARLPLPSPPPARCVGPSSPGGRG